MGRGIWYFLRLISNWKPLLKYTKVMNMLKTLLFMV